MASGGDITLLTNEGICLVMESTLRINRHMKIVAINAMDSDVSTFFSPNPNKLTPAVVIGLHWIISGNLVLLKATLLAWGADVAPCIPLGEAPSSSLAPFVLAWGTCFGGVNLLFLLCSTMYLQPLISKPHRSCAPIGNQMILIAIAKSGKNNALIVTSDVKKCGLPVIHSSIFVLPFWVSSGLLRHWELWVIFFRFAHYSWNVSLNIAFYSLQC